MGVYTRQQQNNNNNIKYIVRKNVCGVAVTRALIRLLTTTNVNVSMFHSSKRHYPVSEIKNSSFIFLIYMLTNFENKNWSKIANKLRPP